MSTRRDTPGGDGSIEDVLSAFSDWTLCKHELQACYDSADSSPGYRCHFQAEREREAREKAGKALTAFVDARIEALTGAA